MDSTTYSLELSSYTPVQVVEAPTTIGCCSSMQVTIAATIPCVL